MTPAWVIATLDFPVQHLQFRRGLNGGSSSSVTGSFGVARADLTEKLNLWRLSTLISVEAFADESQGISQGDAIEMTSGYHGRLVDKDA